MQNLKDSICKKDGRARQPDTLILTAVLNDSPIKSKLIPIARKLFLFKPGNMLEPSEDFKLPNGLSSEAKLDDDTLCINLDLSDSLFITVT